MRPFETLIPATLAAYVLWPFFTGRANPRPINFLPVLAIILIGIHMIVRRVSLANDPLIRSDRDHLANRYTRNAPPINGAISAPGLVGSGSRRDPDPAGCFDNASCVVTRSHSSNPRWSLRGRY